jgi:hypothetical protein
MPSKTKKQSKFMQAVANNPKFAERVGVSQSVGREFVGKDKAMKGKGKKYASGGLAAGHKSADGVAHKGKTKGKQIAMANGGKAGKC